MLAPLLSLALTCQTNPTPMDAMACCRKVHSTCMRGEQADSFACCSRLQTTPSVAALANNRDWAATPTVAAQLTMAACTLPARSPMLAKTRAATGGPPPLALYTLHTSLLI